jgi:Ca2+-binding EF-hand superfamily protein
MPEPTPDDLRPDFNRFDTDGNGIIDEDEFAALIAALGVEFTPEQTQVAFLAIDIDGNGRIDYREFRGWWNRRARI